MRPVADTPGKDHRIAGVNIAVGGLGQHVVRFGGHLQVDDLEQAGRVGPVVQAIARGVSDRIAARAEDRQPVLARAQIRSQVDRDAARLVLTQRGGGDGDDRVIARVEYSIGPAAAQEEVTACYRFRQELFAEINQDRVDRPGLPRRADGTDGRCGSIATVSDQLQGVVGVEASSGHRPAGQRRDRIGPVHDSGLDLRDGGLGVLRGQQGDHTGDVRCRHARAAVGRVVSAGRGGVNRHAGRAQIYGRQTVVGKRRHVVVVVSGRNRNDIVVRVVGRVMPPRIVVRSVVARSRDE